MPRVAGAEAQRAALLACVCALGTDAARGREGQGRQAEVERERDLAVDLLLEMLDSLDEDALEEGDMLVMAASKVGAGIISPMW